MPGASDINKIKTVKKTGPCYKYGGPHCQYECTSNSNSKFQNKTTQKHKKNNYANRFHNKTSNNTFPMGTLSFQTSQPIRSSKDMSVSPDTIKCFLSKIEERYSFKKKMESQHEDTTLIRFISE